jgi:hypothetical protein
MAMPSIQHMDSSCIIVRTNATRAHAIFVFIGHEERKNGSCAHLRITMRASVEHAPNTTL